MVIELPDANLAGLNVPSDRMRLAAAIGLYATEDATLGQAAAVAGLNQTQFLRELGQRGISIHYGVSELDEDLATLNELSPR